MKKQKPMKGKVKANKETRSINANAGTHGLGRSAARRWMFAKPWLARLGCLSLTTGLLWSPSARALNFVPLGEGKLPSGQIVSMFQVTFDPGEPFPWHFHPGPLWGVIVSGTLTEDEGCGTALNTYAAGSAFSETPGRVHRVFNYGTVPVVINFTAIVSPCYSNYNSTILVDGPKCEGGSGRSLLEKIPPCAQNANEVSEPKSADQRANEQEKTAAEQSAMLDTPEPLRHVSTAPHDRQLVVNR